MGGLALELTVNDSVWVGDAQLFVEKVGENKVRVRILAPKEIRILRDELKRRIEEREAADAKS